MTKNDVCALKKCIIYCCEKVARRFICKTFYEHICTPEIFLRISKLELGNPKSLHAVDWKCLHQLQGVGKAASLFAIKYNGPMVRKILLVI